MSNFGVKCTLMMAFVVLDVVTMVSGQDCYQIQCDAECKFREHADHGSCVVELSETARFYRQCYCTDGEDSTNTWPTDIIWCTFYNTDLRCVPLVNRKNARCSRSECNRSCRTRYEGWNWKEVRGACEPFFCRCYGKTNHQFWSTAGTEQAIN